MSWFQKKQAFTGQIVAVAILVCGVTGDAAAGPFKTSTLSPRSLARP